MIFLDLFYASAFVVMLYLLNCPPQVLPVAFYYNDNRTIDDGLTRHIAEREPLPHPLQAR